MRSKLQKTGTASITSRPFRVWYALAVVLALTALPSCALRQQVEIDPADTARLEDLVNECRMQYPDISWITLNEFISREDRDEWIIVDVRSPEERAVSVIPGALSADVFEKFPEYYTNSNILVYCTVGCRSAQYAVKLRERGFRVYDLWGGVLAWALQGKTFAAPDGSPTRKVHVFGSRWNVLPDNYEAVW